MSLENAKQVIDHALNDGDYLNLLLSNPAEALKSYELTESEKTMFEGLSTGPYAHARRGLLEIKKLILAAEEFSTDDGDVGP